MPDQNYDIDLKIANDYYSATLTVEFHQGDYTVEPESIIQYIKSKNVVFGIDMDKVREICEQRLNVYNVIIARGEEHSSGEDAEIQYRFKMESSSKPQILEDGKVDFKNLGLIEMVKKGDVLAVKSLPTKGTVGTTVTGKNVKGKDGKDKIFKLGKNVHISDDGLSVISDSDGKIDFDGEKISVVNLLELRTDVGIETGNITFQGQVVVNGNVTNGYEVDCDGDLVINGVVEGAKISVTGDLTISRGIQGHDEADIYCGGNLIVNFINSASVYVRGNIETGTIMNSNVKCDGEISVKGKKGVIVGGEVASKCGVEAVTIGSELGVTTVIKLGVDAEVMDELKALSVEVRDLIDMHDKLEKSVNLLRVKLEQNPNDDKAKDMYDKYSTNFVTLDKTLAEKRHRLMMLNELINNIKGAQVKARDFYPGTRIKIGNSNYYVKQQLLQAIVTKDRGEITVIGY